ncbi:MAG TPA: hypothetical protein VMK65_01510, partial [Longimicrobiales bacterium]|nr:hypothetical protein [Longimicrobiales bacterium]
PLRVGRAYYLTSELLDVPALRQALVDAAGGSRWDQRAAQALTEDLRRAHRLLTGLVMREGGPHEEVEGLLGRVREQRAGELESYRALLEEIRGEGEPTLPALSLAIRELQGLGAEGH